MNQRKLFESAALFIFVYLVQLALSLHFGGDYAKALLPLYRWEVSHLAQDYQIQSLELVDSRGEGVVMLTLLTQYFVISGYIIPPGISISSSTLIGHALQHPLLICSIATAWPAFTLAQRIVRFCCALPFLLMVELLDIPLILLGSVHELMMANFASDNGSFLIAWMNFLNGGGRLALSLFAGMMAVFCSRLFTPKPDRQTI